MSTEKKEFPRAGEQVSMEMNVHQCKYSGSMLLFKAICLHKAIHASAKQP